MSHFPTLPSELVVRIWAYASPVHPVARCVAGAFIHCRTCPEIVRVNPKVLTRRARTRDGLTHKSYVRRCSGICKAVLNYCSACEPHNYCGVCLEDDDIYGLRNHSLYEDQLQLVYGNEEYIPNNLGFIGF